MDALQPVAWQYRFKWWPELGLGWSDWSTEHNKGEEREGLQWRPLYAVPPSLVDPNKVISEFESIFGRLTATERRWLTQRMTGQEG